MKKSAAKSLVVLIVLCLISCSQENNENDLRIIDLAGGLGKGRIMKLSEIASDIQYIPLETAKEMLIGKNTGENYYENGIFYINSGHISFGIFDKTGKYIRTFNRLGRGPQEYESLHNPDVVCNSGNIVVGTQNRVLEYTSQGPLIRSLNISPDAGFVFSGGEAFKLGDNHYLLSVGVTDSMKPATVIVDTSSKVIKLIDYPEEEWKIIEVNNGFRRSFNDIKYFKFKGKLRVMNGTDPNILGVDEKLNVDTSYIINYGPYKITPRNAKIGSTDKAKVYSYSDVFESDNYLFMQFNLGPFAHKPYLKTALITGKVVSNNISCALFDKRNNTFVLIDQPEIDQTGFVDDIKGGPAFWPQYISSDQYMISMITADEFISLSENPGCSEEIKKLAMTLDESYNPVMVMVKLKR
ncbi:MAG: 6-bladed beta-propeller [Bacteroidales bacterium]|nr:6-bladed beta-propeller [Bacteroidales bacterium]MDD4059028.1 6-bladed beta-propeller [Bacteroidales bacterium]